MPGLAEVGDVLAELGAVGEEPVNALLEVLQPGVLRLVHGVHGEQGDQADQGADAQELVGAVGVVQDVVVEAVLLVEQVCTSSMPMVFMAWAM